MAPNMQMDHLMRHCLDQIVEAAMEVAADDDEMFLSRQCVVATIYATAIDLERKASPDRRRGQIRTSQIWCDRPRKSFSGGGFASRANNNQLVCHAETPHRRAPSVARGGPMRVRGKSYQAPDYHMKKPLDPFWNRAAL
jgi:hypothetical protein